MLYDEITVLFRFTSGIFKTLLLNLNLFALNKILVLQTNKVSLLGYQHIPANCLLSNAIRMYFGSFFQNKYSITVISYLLKNNVRSGGIYLISFFPKLVS
jgi:hypothetical protein